MAQLRNAPFGTSPRLAARYLSRTGRFFASASRPRCWVVMQGYEVRTCSAAPRFKTVTASLGHSFVPPTWKLIRSVHMTQLRNVPFGTSPRLAARSLSRTGRFFASASRPRCWVVMQGYEVRTCSAAPRFKTVTASLGHSFVPPTWKLIRSVHMIHEKRAFVLRDKSSFFV